MLLHVYSHKLLNVLLDYDLRILREFKVTTTPNPEPLTYQIHPIP
jgi:hypothetical protein